MGYEEVSEECFFCGRPREQIHHIFPGSCRKNSTKYGFLLPLCAKCHAEIHRNKQMMDETKRMAQMRYEAEIGTREQFIKEFIKSYL